MENYSLSDLRAATEGSDGMFGAGGGLWVLIIILFLMGGNGFWGNRDGSRAATVEDLNNSANFTRLESQVAANGQLTERKLDAVYSGICDSTYALNNTLSNIRYENAIGQKDLSAQIAQCCCTTQKAIADEGAATRALIQQNKIEALQQRINALELQAATATTVKYPTTMSYAYNANPFCGTGCECSTNI